MSASLSSPLEDAWAAQRVWSQTANRLKTRIDQARATALALGVATAILAVAADQISNASSTASRWAAGAAVLTAGLATLVQRRVSTEQVKAWTRARSASEGLKTEVYSYLAGGTAYTGANRDQRLAEETRRILSDVDDLRRFTLGVSPDDKQPLPVHDVASYLQHRVTGSQVDGFYLPKAARYEKRVRIFRAAGTLLGGLAVVLAALATATGVGGFSAWVPVVTTVATSLAAFVAAARYDHLVIEYLRTADRLTYLRDRHRRAPTLSGPQLVDACEDAISIENKGWMARWSQPPAPPAS
jgi:hypothetical protein